MPVYITHRERERERGWSVGRQRQESGRRRVTFSERETERASGVCVRG